MTLAFHVRARWKGRRVVARCCSETPAFLPWWRLPRLLLTYLLMVVSLNPAFPCARAEGIPQSPAPQRPESSFHFDIPAQALDTALVAYGRVTGTQVLYDSRLRSSRQSSAVVGTFTPKAALQALLKGTDLVVHYTSSGDVVLHPTDQLDGAAASLPSPDTPTLSLQTLHVLGTPQIGPVAHSDFAFRFYADVVAQDVRQALRQNPRTSGGSFRVLARLWLSPVGVVQRTVLTNSTGSTFRDDVIVKTLLGLKISQPPPAALPQPINIVLWPGS